MSLKILAVIKKEFFSLLKVLVGVDSDAMITVNPQDFHQTVGLGRVVGETDLASHPEGGNPVEKRKIFKTFPYLAASTQNFSFI